MRALSQRLGVLLLALGGSLPASADPTASPLLAPPPTAGSAPAPAPASGEVVLLNGSQQIAMRYVLPELRADARGQASAHVLARPRAPLRIYTGTPGLIVEVPAGDHPGAHFAIVQLQQPGDGTRALALRPDAPGGLAQLPALAVTVQKISDRKRGPRGLVIFYRVSFAPPLPVGEYALVVRGNRYFDFGVDSLPAKP